MRATDSSATVFDGSFRDIFRRLSRVVSAIGAPLIGVAPWQPWQCADKSDATAQGRSLVTAPSLGAPESVPPQPIAETTNDSQSHLLDRITRSPPEPTLPP